jgi:hypothetical protein
MMTDECGKHPGLNLTLSNGSIQRGYRFIIDNAQLAKLSGMYIPQKTRDIVGEIMAYEQGELDEEQTLKLFQYLKQENMLSSLQGHYGREAKRLNIA